MKFLFLRLFIITILSFISLSCSNDDQLNDHNSILVGSWSRSLRLGGIYGTETFIFNSNNKYSVKLVRTESYNGPCSLDPFCDNDYSGDYWFTGNNLCIDSDEHGWNECYSWSVNGDILTIQGDQYYKD